MTQGSKQTILAAAALCLTAAPAFAHAHLESAIPAENATVRQAPTELDLTFSEGLNPKFTGAKLTGPDNADIPMGKAELGPGGDATLVVPVPVPLPAGIYRVDWHALAADGHKSTGTYTFTIKP